MGRYVQRPKKKISARHIVLLVVLLLLLAAAIWIAGFLPRSEAPKPTPTPFFPQESQPTADTEDSQTSLAALVSDGLQIIHMSNYAGIYMEDGSDEVVTNVMMIILENTSDQDLQLARINIHYPDFTAEFEATNLPAGEKAVLLEKNRRSMPEGACISMESRNVAFFQTPMSLMEDIFEITGGNGYLDVKNISESATNGKIYVYYKRAASDSLYGGITFRATINQSVAPGETIRILTNHYTADNSRILAITCSK